MLWQVAMISRAKNLVATQQRDSSILSIWRHQSNVGYQWHDLWIWKLKPTSFTQDNKQTWHVTIQAVQECCESDRRRDLEQRCLKNITNLMFYCIPFPALTKGALYIQITSYEKFTLLGCHFLIQSLRRVQGNSQ